MVVADFVTTPGRGGVRPEHGVRKGAAESLAHGRAAAEHGLAQVDHPVALVRVDGAGIEQWGEQSGKASDGISSSSKPPRNDGVEISLEPRYRIKDGEDSAGPCRICRFVSHLSLARVTHPASFPKGP